MQPSFAAQIAAHRAHLAMLRAQRPFRSLAHNVVYLNAHPLAKFPLVGLRTRSAS